MVSNQGSYRPPGASFGRFDPAVPALLLGVVIVIVAAFFSFRTLFAPTPLDAWVGEALAQSAQSAPLTAQSGEGNTEGEDEAAVEAPVVTPVLTSAEIFSWSDDGGDHPDMAGYLVDNDPQTIYRTRYFAGSSFAEGSEIAILLRLAEPAPVSSITIDVIGSGGLVEIVDPAENSPREGTVLGSVTLEPQTIIALDPALEMSSIGLVFKELPIDDEGRLRAKISGITVE